MSDTIRLIETTPKKKSTNSFKTPKKSHNSALVKKIEKKKISVLLINWLLTALPV